MLKCSNNDGRPATQTGVINGKFGSYCPVCIGAAYRSANGQSAQWHRDRDSEDHRKDMIQPKDPKTGKINPEFVRAYPDESAEMFTKEDIGQALRDT